MTERIFHELVDAFPKLLLPAIKVTIPLTLLSFSIGLLIALTTALVQVAKIPVLRLLLSDRQVPGSDRYESESNGRYCKPCGP